METKAVAVRVDIVEASTSNVSEETMLYSEDDVEGSAEEVSAGAAENKHVDYEQQISVIEKVYLGFKLCCDNVGKKRSLLGIPAQPQQMNILIWLCYMVVNGIIVAFTMY